MRRQLEYIVIAVTALIFTFYHAILTSLIIASFDSLEYSFTYIFIIEILAFIPMAIGMFMVMWAGGKWPELFTRLSLKILISHLGFASLLFIVHSIWQPLVNSYFFNESIEFVKFTSDFISFLEMRFLVYVIIVGLVSGLIKIREQQQFKIKQSELNLKLQKARLKEMELKMNPEIIYPNLGFIKEKASSNPEEASQMVILMASILRRLVDNIEDEKVKLSDEATFFSMYTDLIKLRLEKSFEVKIWLNTELEDKKVPSMILIIPFFEELFFGKYSTYLKRIDEIIFSVERISDSNVAEVISVKGISESIIFSKMLKEEPLIKKINDQLGTFSKGNFEFQTELEKEVLVLKLASQEMTTERSYAN